MAGGCGLPAPQALAVDERPVVEGFAEDDVI
jgi:hypothetical protein